MITTLLIVAAAATAVDAERAFNAMAQREGQWTAFRAFAAPEAVMFAPGPVAAQQWLAGRKDPPASVRWRPAKSWVSCDGTIAVNTGPWTRPDGSTGYFTTIWAKRPDQGWKWLVDHGDALAKPRAAGARPAIRRAACKRPPGDAARAGATLSAGGRRLMQQGSSPDRTLSWSWKIDPDGRRTVTVELWNGKGSEIVLEDVVSASS